MERVGKLYVFYIYTVHLLNAGKWEMNEKGRAIFFWFELRLVPRKFPRIMFAHLCFQCYGLSINLHKLNITKFKFDKNPSPPKIAASIVHYPKKHNAF